MISAEATDTDHPALVLYQKRYDDLRLYLEALVEVYRNQGQLRVGESIQALRASLLEWDG